MMGAPFDEAHPEDGKPRRVRITRGFYLDQFEVTVAQFARFLRSHGNRCGEADCFNNAYEPPIDISNERFEVRPGTETLPMAHVAFRVAVAFCEWAGKRLPTEAEWELAARHDPVSKQDRLYPWGDTYRDGVTNCARDECNDGYPLEAPVGAFREDRSPIGAYDMGGNAYEWVNDCYRKNVECGDPCVDPSITDHCDQICEDRRGKQVCWEGFLVRGGSTATPITSLRASARTSSPAEAGGGIRCVRAGLAPR
jgi:formylglycine-generating enzyme required for sulfatase activity